MDGTRGKRATHSPLPHPIDFRRSYDEPHSLLTRGSEVRRSSSPYDVRAISAVMLDRRMAGGAPAVPLAGGALRFRGGGSTDGTTDKCNRRFVVAAGGRL